jgi:hypothetical protein
MTNNYEDKSGSLTMEKQSQNKPNQTQFMVSLSNQQTQFLPAVASAKAGRL